MTERTNEEWLADLKQSDLTGEAALQDLRDFILRGILGYLRTRSDMNRLDPHDLQQLAEDTAQDALLKIQAKMDTFQGKSKFTTWATKIAINHLISDLRRQRWKDVSLNEVLDSGTSLEEMISSGPDDEGNPALATERGMVWGVVKEVLEEGLTDRQRQAIVATQLNGIPMQEAARMLNTNTNNLYKLIHDARLKIKRNLISQGLEPSYIMELFG
ncbi:MAG: RNA polymerase sigma factor [Chloroflexota bacterium]